MVEVASPNQSVPQRAPGPKWRWASGSNTAPAARGARTPPTPRPGSPPSGGERAPGAGGGAPPPAPPRGGGEPRGGGKGPGVRGGVAPAVPVAVPDREALVAEEV